MTNPDPPDGRDALNALARNAPAARRVRLQRAEGCRRLVLPLLARLAHDRLMEDGELPVQPSTRPRPRLN